MGDFDEVERLQEESARGCGGRREAGVTTCAISVPRPAAAAVCGGVRAGVADRSVQAAGAAGLGVLSSVGAGVLAGLLDRAAERAWSAPGLGGPAARSPQPDLHPVPPINRSLEREIRRSVGEVLGAGDKQADDLRSDIAMVMREIDAGGTLFRASIEAGDEEFEREVLAAFEELSAEFGDMAFMLADLARAAGEIQDSLAGQDAELRAASEQVGRQSADVRMIREELAVIEQRTRQWLPEPELTRARAGPAAARTAGCCPTTRLTRRCSTAGSGSPRSWRAS